jgi:hypothetical protein
LLERRHRVLHRKAVLPRVLGDFVEPLLNKFFFLHELDGPEGLGRQLDGLVEPLLAAVRHVHHLPRNTRSAQDDDDADDDDAEDEKEGPKAQKEIKQKIIRRSNYF